MSYVKIWVHSVWGTKNRSKILTTDIRNKLYEHIKDNVKLKGIFLDTINGHMEHVHCLHTLNADMTIANTMKLIKGESAFWMNKNKIIQTKFEWADEYFAVSVSESLVNKVRDYIKNQEEHHRTITFMEEYSQFISKYGFGSHD